MSAPPRRRRWDCASGYRREITLSAASPAAGQGGSAGPAEPSARGRDWVAAPRAGGAGGDDSRQLHRQPGLSPGQGARERIWGWRRHPEGESRLPSCTGRPCRARPRRVALGGQRGATGAATIVNPPDSISKGDKKRWPLSGHSIPHGSQAGGMAAPWPPTAHTVTPTRAHCPASTSRRISSQLQSQMPRSTAAWEETLQQRPIHHPGTAPSTFCFFSVPGAARGSLRISQSHWENLTSAKANTGQTHPAQRTVQLVHLCALTALANLCCPTKPYPENALQLSPGLVLASGLGWDARPGIRFGRKEAERVARWRMTFAFRGS